MRIAKSIKSLLVIGLVCALLAPANANLRADTKALATSHRDTVKGSAPTDKNSTASNPDAPVNPITPEKGTETIKVNDSLAATDSTTANQTTDSLFGIVIVVGGRTLTGPLGSPQQRGGRIFLPVVSIARVLGDAVNVNAASRIIEVRRQTGVNADFNAGLNQIRENGAIVLVVSNTADIVFPPNADELMLPVEIVSALLDVSVRVDEASRAVRITRGQTKTEAVRVGAQHSRLELYQIDYDYNFNRYSSSANQALTLRASGRIGDGRFDFVTSSGSGRGLGLGLPRNGTFTYERAGGQRFIGGDFGTGTDLLFMSSSVRGAWAQLPVNDVRLTAFAGRAVSGVLPFLSLAPLQSGAPDSQSQIQFGQNKLRYDTSIIGAYATYDPSLNAVARNSSLQLSSGVLHFNGAQRSGEMLTGSVRYSTRRHRLQGDIAAGSFNGTQSDNTRVKGFGFAADFSESFDVSDKLTVQGRYAHTSANFLSPQAGVFAPVNFFAGGATWRPLAWLNTSLSASNSTRIDSSNEQARVLAATIGITPRNPSLPTIFLSHTQSSASRVANSGYTLLNASKSFSRWRLFLNATRIKTIGAAYFNAQVGSDVRLGEYGTLQVTQSFGSRGAIGGAADWQTQNFLKKSIYLSGGVSYARTDASHLTLTERISTNVHLLRRNTLQFSYINTQNSPTLLLSLRGSLLRGRSAEFAGTTPIADLNSYGAFYGRVYQDVDLDGRYEPNVDKPLANVKVRVDGNRYVVSNESGNFRIDGMKTGDHELNLDLLSVRADLTLLDTAQQTATLVSRHDSIVDFRLVRTGRIAGVVWIDANGNNKVDEGEQMLSDVRVVAGSNRDTLTDTDGVFILSDLAPGEHVVLIDEKTLPEKMRSLAGSLTLKVSAGSETGNANFPIAPVAPEVKRFTSKAN